MRRKVEMPRPTCMRARERAQQHQARKRPGPRPLKLQTSITGHWQSTICTCRSDRKSKDDQ
eukprot:202652-Chlamydomonas_euryale.AAC.2